MLLDVTLLLRCCRFAQQPSLFVDDLLSQQLSLLSTAAYNTVATVHFVGHVINVECGKLWTTDVESYHTLSLAKLNPIPLYSTFHILTALQLGRRGGAHT